MKAIILILVLFILFSQDCFAYNVNDALTEKIDLSSFYEMLPDVVKGICGENEVLSGQAVSELLHELVNEALESFYDQLVSAWSPAAQTLLIVLICSILSVFLNEKKYNFLFVCIGGTAIIYVCIADVESYFSYSIRVIQELYEFSTVMLPCMATVSVLTGATISTGVKYTAASLFMNILLNFCNSFLIPLVSMYMATVVGYEVFGQKILGVISNFIRWGCLTVLTGTIVLFTSYLTVSGILTSSADALSTKLAGSAISTLLPIVGGIISDTASTIVAGATLLRSSIGVLGMISVFFILMVPLIAVGCRYLMFRVVSEIADIYPERKFSGIIKGIADAYGMLFAIVGSGLIMLFLTLLSFMQLVVV